MYLRRWSEAVGIITVSPRCMINSSLAVHVSSPGEVRECINSQCKGWRCQECLFLTLKLSVHFAMLVLCGPVPSQCTHDSLHVRSDTNWLSNLYWPCNDNLLLALCSISDGIHLSAAASAYCCIWPFRFIEINADEISGPESVLLLSAVAVISAEQCANRLIVT